jgi:NADH-quinone oxidoreductase subunit L
MKAFIVNRVGDFGLALGVAATYLVFDSVQYDAIFQAAPRFENTTIEFLGGSFDTLTVICLLLFVGAMGKSAQLGLTLGCPTRWRGPTPVSALIHAATMVTAGVFLVARMSPVFEYAPTALAFVTFIGARPRSSRPRSGLVQNDIKRVIAYSTCSQLGYMFFACGVSAYGAGIFHLYTHAFFKALLFLGAGSVIHAVHDEQDLRKMGGIWRKIPVTYASCGSARWRWPASRSSPATTRRTRSWRPPGRATGPFGKYAFWLGLFAALLTAFYSWRLLFLAFHGEPRMDHHTYEHVHESPRVMRVPLIVLAVGRSSRASSATGMIEPEGEFWAGAIFMRDHPNILEEMHHVPFMGA